MPATPPQSAAPSLHSGRELLPLGWGEAEIRGWADLRPDAPAIPVPRATSCACGGRLLPGSSYCRDCFAEDAAEDLYRVQLADRRAW